MYLRVTDTPKLAKVSAFDKHNFVALATLELY